MKKKSLFLVPVFVLFASFFLFGFAQAGNRPTCSRTIDPIVTTDWLAANLNKKNLVIVDIRSAGEYAEGHIPGSINEPFVTGFDDNGPSSNWIVGIDGLWLQLPHPEDLYDTIGKLGIISKSRVVIVTAPNPDPEVEPPFFGLANATRVALTLVYAEIKNVAILDGGYPKWVQEKRTTTDESPNVTPVTYRGKVNKAMFVSMDYVKKHIRKSDIIDARDAEVHYGLITEPFAPVPGHIPSAKSLPAPWIWELDETETYYTYKPDEILSAMASETLGEPWGWKRHLNQEVIVYCGVGGYASSWWFVLTQVLGYQNVRVYDGSAQEWVRYYDMVSYQ
jgi:thiosulfate/3-mercaptopyruvate sulfurtransferase